MFLSLSGEKKKNHFRASEASNLTQNRSPPKWCGDLMWKPCRCFRRLEKTNQTAASTTHFLLWEDWIWTLTGLA